jgi:hypothetical protein
VRRAHNWSIDPSPDGSKLADSAIPPSRTDLWALDNTRRFISSV